MKTLILSLVAILLMPQMLANASVQSRSSQLVTVVNETPYALTAIFESGQCSGHFSDSIDPVSINNVCESVVIPQGGTTSYHYNNMSGHVIRMAATISAEMMDSSDAAYSEWSKMAGKTFYTNITGGDYKGLVSNADSSSGCYVDYDSSSADKTITINRLYINSKIYNPQYNDYYYLANCNGSH